MLPGRSMLGRAAIYVWGIVVFAASEILASALGVRFADETLGRLYQYLDPVILRDDLLSGLYYLHSQPPLFNLGLGVVLKLFPGSHAAAFSLAFGVLALGLLLGMAWLLRSLGVSDGVNGLVCLLFALHPNFLVYRHWLFYTLPVAFLLAAGAIALKRSAVTAFCVLAGVLMLTRSVFHPLWFVLAVAVLAFIGEPGARRRLIAGGVVTLFVVNLWFLKNERLVGSFTASTWLGLSLSKRWPLSQSETVELKRRGALPPFWHRRPFREPRELEGYGFFRPVEGLHPALGAPYKSNGEPNFNHQDYVDISTALLDGNLYLMRNYPARYARRVATSLLLFLQPGPNSVDFLVDYDFERVGRYRDAITRFVFFGGGFERPIRMLTPRPNLLLVLFPLLLAVGVLELRGSRGREVYAFLLVTVMWVTLVANLVEIGENDRMRWEVEPFLAIWLAVLLEKLRGKLRSSAAAERV
ncbi:MAG TPA: hypothetical protein VEK15_30680 [Vicinamibacteria bacterium]|nr:hypothetical protein [Vicinamibacteria bacterium]